jgi:adenine phosphoribosyltransferase
VNIQSLVQDVPDFPKPGILFKDISPLLHSIEGYRHVIDTFAYRYAKARLDVVIGIESRGFLFASTLAYALRLPLALIRKQGKLPHPKISHSYELEYGNDTIELHETAVQAGTRALLIDDLLATGGTALAGCELIEKMGGEVVEIATVIELAYLHGRERLKGYDVFSQLVYD